MMGQVIVYDLKSNRFAELKGCGAWFTIYKEDILTGQAKTEWWQDQSDEKGHNLLPTSLNIGRGPGAAVIEGYWERHLPGNKLRRGDA